MASARIGESPKKSGAMRQKVRKSSIKVRQSHQPLCFPGVFCFKEVGPHLVPRKTSHRRAEATGTSAGQRAQGWVGKREPGVAARGGGSRAQVGKGALPGAVGQWAGWPFFLTGTSICRGSLMPAASPKACRRLRMRGVTSCPRLISRVPVMV
jgi:hypothetical protein